MKNNTIQKNIPVDWQVAMLSEVANFRRGSFPQPYGLDKWYDDANGMPFIQVFDVSDNFRLKKTTKRKISLEAQKMSVYVPTGTIILTIQGSIGRIAKTNYDAYIDRTLLIFQSYKKSVDKMFFMFAVFLLFEKEKNRADGGTIKTITKETLNSFKINLPPLSEQKRIVAVLETWDQIIEKLAKKIKIKKGTKKGLMQKLLTGKIRLTGFNDKWETFEIGELLDYEQPTKYIVKSTEYSDLHKIPVLTANKGFVLGYTDETDGIYKDTPAIIFDDFTMDNKYVDFPFKVKSSAIKILKQKNSKINLRFVFEKMQLFNIVIGQHKRNYISEYQFLTMDMPSIKEQDAIANIIITADSEIKALEKRLTILKDQKKYLLNNLITGAIRIKA